MDYTDIIRIRDVVRWSRLVVQSLRHDGLGFLGLWPRVQRIVPGWLMPRDARFLYALAQRGPGDGAIVEIGSAWGLSTIFLAAGSRAASRERVYAIDPHTGDPWYLLGDYPIWPPSAGLRTCACAWLIPLVSRGARRPTYLPDRPASGFSSLSGFQANIRRFGLEQWVTPVVATSEDAPKQVEIDSIRLLYIDGLHTYDGVHADIETWLPRVVPGGVVVFDDYDNTLEGMGVKQAVDELLGTGKVVARLRRAHSLVWTVKL